jgi:hypothetical protein
MASKGSGRETNMKKDGCGKTRRKQQNIKIVNILNEKSYFNICARHLSPPPLTKKLN